VAEIPENIIGEVAAIFSDFYTHAALDRLFRAKGEVSVNDFPGNKSKKIMHGLDKINENIQIGHETDPLTALGKILEDYMDAILPAARDDFLGNKNEIDMDINRRRCENRERIQRSLNNTGLIYQHGGIVAPLAAQPSSTLVEQIKNQGFPAVQQEVKRAEQALQSGDSAAAIHRAGVLLEAVYKAYLDKNQQTYGNKDTAADLWQKVVEHMGIRPGEQSDTEWRAICSNLYQIAQNIMQLRNRYGSHGANNVQHSAAQNIIPAQARLTLNAAAALSSYILEV